MGEATLSLTKSDTVPSPSPAHPSPPPPPPSRKSITTATWIAIMSYLFSLPLLCYGMWLLLTKDYQCQDSLNMPHFREAIGLGLILAFAISCFVTHYEAKVVLPGALTLAVALLVMLTFGILLIGSHSMESRGVPASPLWVKSRIDNPETWAGVKGCIYDLRTCPDLAYDNIELNADEFNQKELSSIESGCCKPPSVCGMRYLNATYWRPPPVNATSPPPANATVNPDTYGDCQGWSNEMTKLCYDCQSCKEAFVRTVHHSMWAHGFFMIFMSSVLLSIHTPRFVITMLQRNRS